MLARHNGHERFERSHVSMHSAWKAWQQRGRERRRSELRNFDKQTAQSAAVTAEERREMDENVKRGSESMTEGGVVSGEIRRL